MQKEIVSKKTRNEVREFLTGWTLREIEIVFDNASVSADRNFSPNVNGERRFFVEQLYHTLDFHKAEDALRYIAVVEGVLQRTEQNLSSCFDRNSTEMKIQSIISCLKADGFNYQNGKIYPYTTDTKKMIYQISEVTRRSIFKELRKADIKWCGELGEDEFLAKLYELDTLPSNDARYGSFRGDWFQHRINNHDWDDDWVYTDNRFNLIGGSDENFTAFLCMMLHPVVRPDVEESKRLQHVINGHLQNDGWEVVSANDYLSGRPIYVARKITQTPIPLSREVHNIGEKFDSDYMKRQITRMHESIESDPELAIGTAKEFIETCFKTILDERGIALKGIPSISDLSKTVFKELKLAPENVDDEKKGSDTIKRLLSNLSSLGQSIGEIRNLYGTGHGKHAKSKSITPRHAKLAVGVATTLAVFLFETHQIQKSD